MKKGEKYECISNNWDSFKHREIYYCNRDNCLVGRYNNTFQMVGVDFKDFQLVTEIKEIMKIEKGNSYLCIKDYIMLNGDKRFTKDKIYESTSDDELINDKKFTHTIDEHASDFFQLVTDSKTPIHYQTKSGYDVIDFCNDNKLNFNRGSAIKYIAIAGKKDDEIKDLEKAINFLQREIKFLKNEVHDKRNI